MDAPGGSSEVQRRARAANWSRRRHRSIRNQPNNLPTKCWQWRSVITAVSDVGERRGRRCNTDCKMSHPGRAANQSRLWAAAAAHDLAAVSALLATGA